MSQEEIGTISRLNLFSLNMIDELLNNSTLHVKEDKLTQWDIETMPPNELINRSREVALASRNPLLVELVNRYMQCCQTKKT